MSNRKLSVSDEEMEYISRGLFTLMLKARQAQELVCEEKEAKEAIESYISKLNHLRNKLLSEYIR